MSSLRKLLFFIFISFFNVAALAEEPDLSKLSNLSFSELKNVVTSVSKRPEDAFTAPAAIYVITQEDIKNSGLRTIPEILRMTPGLQVAQSDGESWAITSRGFNSDGFGNKLLVLIDGRSVYTPLYSGVYWDVQDTFIDDIDRIEVIRGPGATLWGANAVNGVINIITKSAKETQSNIVNMGIGKETKSFAELRSGQSYKDKLFYRVYGKFFDNDSTKTISGNNGGNDSQNYRSGFKAEWDSGSENSYTIQGDIYKNDESLSLSLPNGTRRNDDAYVSGSNIITKLQHKHDNSAKSSIQMYFDRASADYSLLHQDNYTFDLDYQYDVTLGSKHNLVTGLGYRYITDDLQGSDLISYQPTSWDRSLYSAFLQDTYKLFPDKFHVTLGSKFEHNDFTGFEVQPSARFGWYLNQNNTIWGSVSRAVRTPNRSEVDLSLVVASGYVRWQGNDNFKSEELVAYELGYRVKPAKNISFDVTSFINKYQKLRTNELSYDNLPSDTVAGLPFANNAKATSRGVELASSWQVTHDWQLKGSYTFLTMDIETTNASSDTLVAGQAGGSPKHQFGIQSQLYLPYRIEFSNALYYVENLPNLGVPSYYRFDSRIMWTARPGLEFSIVGQNLLDDRHQEFSGPLHGTSNEIERNVYGKVTVRF